jgi:site-specific recombinase XerC
MAHTLPVIGAMPLRKVTADHLDRFHERKLAGGMSGNGVAKLRTMESKAGQLWADKGLVFCTQLGTPLVSWNVARRFFRPALQQAGCPDIRLYDLRHSSATLLRAWRCRSR